MNRNQLPTIRPLPTENEIKGWMDILVAPGESDRAARAAAKLVLTVADAENDELYHLATVAAKHAFTKTLAFQAAFEEFAELPETAAARLVFETGEHTELAS